MNKPRQFVRNNTTGEAGVLLEQYPGLACVHWPESGDVSVVPFEDITFVHVPVPRTAIIHHSVTQDSIELLEDQFAYRTENGWMIPEWIDLLRHPLNRNLYG
jgi:hypothetical protein